MGALAAVVFALFGAWALRGFADFLRRRKDAPYPPGPSPKPLIGNILDFPLVKVPETYLEWGKKYNSESIREPSKLI